MEKYGEKPKRFTKAWYQYVWDYYKIHIIVSIFLVVAVIYTVIAMTSTKEYDLVVYYATNQQITDEAKGKLTQEFAKVAKDIDGDGKVNVIIYEHPFVSDYDDIEYKRALEEKFHLELQAGEGFLYVISKDVLDTLKYNSAVEGVFAKPSEWGYEKECEWDFAKVEEGGVIESCGIIEDDIFVGVRNFRYSEKEEKDGPKRENAILAAEAILK